MPPFVLDCATLSPLYEKRSNLRCEDPKTIRKVLKSDAVARRILAKGEVPQPGQYVGVRLNINVFKSTGVVVHSVHRGGKGDGHTKGRGLYKGEVINYLPFVHLKDTYFNVNQSGRDGIASGKMAKHPMASIDGTFCTGSGRPCFDGIEISFNPHTTHLFLDSKGYAIEYAEDVTILGHRAYARGVIRYYSEKEAPKCNTPSRAKYLRRLPIAK